MIIDKIRAGAGVDDVRAAIAVDGLRARTTADRVRGGGTQDREGPGQSGGVDVLEILDRRRTRHILIGRREIEAHRRGQHQRAVGSRTAVDRTLRAVVIDDVRGDAANDHVQPAFAVDGLRRRAAGDRVGGRRAQNRYRGRHGAGVDVQEVLDRRRARSVLIGRCEIEAYARLETQRAVDARAAVDRTFLAVVIDDIRRRPANDHVARAAVAVDGVRPRTAGNGVRAGRTHDRQSRANARGVHIGEARHCWTAGDLIARIGEIHRRRRIEIERARARTAVQRSFRAVIVNQIGPGPAVDDIRAAIAVDGLRARTAADRVCACGAQDRERAGQTGGVDVLEVLDRRRTRHILAGSVGEIEAHRRGQHQRAIGARTAVERNLGAMVIDEIGGGAADNHVLPATAVDRLRSRTAGDRVGRAGAEDRHGRRNGTGVDVQELLDRRRPRHVLVGRGEIEADPGIENQRAVDARAAVDRILRPMIIYDVRRRAADDDVVTAIAVHRVGCAAARNRVVSGRAENRQRRTDARGVHIGEARDVQPARYLIARVREIHVRREIEIERARPRTAVH